MSYKRRKGLTDEEIKKLLKELSENESDGGEIDNFSVESDDEFQPQTSSESEDCDVSEQEESRNKRGNTDQSMSKTVFTAPDNTTWNEMNSKNSACGRVPAYNVLKEAAGPTSFAKTRVSEDKVSSSFKLFIDDYILLHIKQCTEAEAHRKLGNKNWKLSMAELDAFIAILYVRGAIGANGSDLHSLWSEAWGIPFCKETISRDRFKEILRFLRFDEKTTRSTRLQTDKFALASKMWNKFIENCKICYRPGQNITIDEQLFPSKARCKFTQYMPNKPDKFGLKFWLSVDVDTKYLLNGFPYLGKDETANPELRLSENVVMKLIEPHINKGRNITTDNYFTSIKLAEMLKSKNTTLVGTKKKNRREVPISLKNMHSTLYSSTIVEHDNITLTIYQAKRNKSVFLLSSLHSTVKTEDSQKKLPDSIAFYNATKYGVDIRDQMCRKYSVKSASRRWPVHIFFNILDHAALNAWIIYKSVTEKSVSRRDFLLKLGEELRMVHMASKLPKILPESSEKSEVQKIKRKRCQIQMCNGNKSQEYCASCSKVVCGKCTGKIVKKYFCVNCMNS